MVPTFSTPPLAPCKAVLSPLLYVWLEILSVSFGQDLINLLLWFCGLFWTYQMTQRFLFSVGKKKDSLQQRIEMLYHLNIIGLFTRDCVDLQFEELH